LDSIDLLLSSITAIAALLAAIVAVLGILLQRQVAAAQVKPLLNIEELTSLEELKKCAVLYLVNDGSGTAVIISASFHRGGRSGLSLKDVLDLEDKGLLHIEGHEFGEQTSYLRSKHKIALLSMSYLGSNLDARKQFDEVGKEIEQTKIAVIFKDIFGRKQPTLDRSFDNIAKLEDSEIQPNDS
jgi:hypothetical protein